MRFLCLHGAGTNEELFDIQSGGLRQQLEEKGHVFIFLNGYLESKPHPDIEGVSDGPFYNHYPRDSAPGEILSKAFEHTYQMIQRHGPFDAVMGFSQGGALAASLIIHHANTHGTQLFKAAVFICAAAPYESSGVQHILSTPGEHPITIPTANIVGNQDTLYEQSMQVYRLCEPGKAEFYDHGSRHGIPFDRKNTQGMAETVEKTVDRAMRG